MVLTHLLGPFLYHIKGLRSKTFNAHFAQALIADVAGLFHAIGPLPSRDRSRELPHRHLVDLDGREA
jgi:hypothetical protein